MNQMKHGTATTCATERELNEANAQRLAMILRTELKIQPTLELECYQKSDENSVRLIIEPGRGQFGLVIGTKDFKLVEAICKLLSKEKT